MKKLHRSLEDKKMAGICGGIGEVYSVDPLLLRLAFVFLCLATGVVPLLVTYIMGWIMVPKGLPQQTGV